MFLLFLGLMVPFAIRSAKSVMYNAMSVRTDELIDELELEQTSQDMVLLLKARKPILFYRVTLMTGDRQVLYDTHTKRLVQDKFSPEFRVNQPEIMQAIAQGVGYHEEYSVLLQQDFAYLAKKFTSHGEPYILRISFPLKYVMQITDDFLLELLWLSTFILLLFSIVIAVIFNHFSKPIQEIQEAIRPYQKGLTKNLPAIKLSSQDTEDEFSQLANTLNLLSESIQKQIDTLVNERREKETILESLEEAVIAIDPTQSVHFANKMALVLFSEPSFAAIEKAIFKENRFSSGDLLREAFQKKHPVNRHVEVNNPGSKKLYHLAAIPMQDELSGVLVVSDQTSAWRLIEMRKDFVANASHELKTPITVIQGFAETLHDHPELDREHIKSMTEKIVRNCERMTHLIRQLLLLSDVEHLPLSQLETSDVRWLIERCKTLLLEIYPEAVIEITPAEPIPMNIVGDPVLLERAFLNLLDNAVKYSHSPANVEIGLKEDPSNITITIQDHGIGIAPKDQEAIFSRFFRTGEARSKGTGSGLGLSIVQTIVQKHFGSIDVQSELNQGTRFILTLPKEPPIKR